MLPKEGLAKALCTGFLSEQIVVEFLSELISSSELSYICHGILDVRRLQKSLFNGREKQNRTNFSSGSL